MFTTGNSFIDYLFIAITFLPLAPAFLSLFSNFGKESFQLIFILCLVNFIRDLPIHLHMLTPGNQAFTNNICYPIELLLIFRLFYPVWTKPTRYMLILFLVAYLSSLLTWLSVKGWSNSSLEIVKNIVLLGIVLLSLTPLVRSKGLDIFQSPLFWVAGGTSFYLLIILLLEGLNPCCIAAPVNAESSVFLSLAALVRYVLYTLAVWPRREELPENIL